MSIKRQDLLDAAHSFCNAFASQKPLDQVLSHFSQSQSQSQSSFPILIEHGLQQLAPFLGRQFTSLSGAKEYFTIISDLLSYENMQFSEYFADSETRQVSVKGRARFTWKSTGESWDEVFTYRLTFDDELKVKVYEVWADSGAAYLARKGQLE